MARWLSPDEPWPPHKHPEWKKSLRSAREAGWHCHPFTNHNFGRVVCRVEPQDDRCALLIFTTGDGTETVARELGKMVERCPHRDASSDAPAGAEGRVRAAERHIANAESLLIAASTARDAQVADDRLVELVTLFYEQLDLGEDALRELEEVDAQQEVADRAHQDRERVVSELELPSDVSVEDLVSLVDRALAAGRRVLRSPVPGALQGVRSDLLDRLTALQVRVRSLQEDG